MSQAFQIAHRSARSHLDRVGRLYVDGGWDDRLISTPWSLNSGHPALLVIGASAAGWDRNTALWRAVIRKASAAIVETADLGSASGIGALDGAGAALYAIEFATTTTNTDLVPGARSTLAHMIGRGIDVGVDAWRNAASFADLPGSSWDYTTGLIGAVTCARTRTSSRAVASIQEPADRAVAALVDSILAEDDPAHALVDTCRRRRDTGLGLVHGVAGLLNLLGQEADSSGLRRDALAALSLATQLRRALDDGNENVGYYAGAQAWCRGDLGVRIALQNSRLLRSRFDGLLRTLSPDQSPPETPSLNSLSVCHGMTGVLAVESAFAARRQIRQPISPEWWGRHADSYELLTGLSGAALTLLRGPGRAPNPLEFMRCSYDVDRSTVHPRFPC
ncbi:lanthionine synthetase LanC family protein [Tsukamurella paurometabola]|uniref:lanthionine synthetase LanC family protein n=1 Tax=Tsukamurella paurometabola TaxID=2061 RepID=UPI000F7F706E|nr:lanthionine synthetase LanC family protein [Tsukamurella paurometabola]UEA81438.1 hypothetical protein LK411_13580 [Tsukamurella paurometabola]